MEEKIINVKGMVCNGCENRVKNALKTIDGVKDVDASYKTGIVKVKQNKEIKIEDLKEKIKDIGFEVE